MKQRWAILVDLDQTLIETSALADLRRQRNWTEAYKSFHLTKLFPGTDSFLRVIQKYSLLSLGVVTRSPRPYAEKLLAYHKCQVPVLVAYYDSPRQKPFPDPILKALEKLQVPPTNCFHIGDAPDDIIATQRAKAIPIGLCWDNSLRNEMSKLPPFALCNDWKEVLKEIHHKISEKEQ